MTSAIPEDRAVAICAVRPFDRATLAALCHLDPHLVIRWSTSDPGELLGFIGGSQAPTVVLLGARLLREAGGAVLVDQLHETTAHPRVVLVGTDEHGTELAVAARADAYLRLDADLDDQLAQILG